MIIVRIPFRIPIGGGGTDLPEYYYRYRGLLITSTINRYMYVMVNEPATSDKIKLYHHSKETVSVDEIDKIEHAIIRESLKLHNIRCAIEIGSMSDIEAGTGLGSSSVFTVGLLAGLNALQKRYVSPLELAEEACHVEMDLVGKPIGKQDQYAASLGGFNKLEIDKKGNVKATPVVINKEIILELESRLLMFYTGITRDANEILADQGRKISFKEGLGYMHSIKSIGVEIESVLVNGDIDTFGRLLDLHWEMKKKMSSKMTSSVIDNYYELAKYHGALGGKLMGAGGGGVFLFCVKQGKRKEFKEKMEKSGLKFMDFKFEFEGCKVLTNI